MTDKQIKEQYKSETGKPWNVSSENIWHYKDWLENKLAELQGRTCETCKHKEDCAKAITQYLERVEIVYCSAYEKG